MENTFSESYLERIEKMCEVPMKLCLPDGTNVQFGDAWQGKPGQHTEQFLEWSKLFNRSDFLYLATDGEEGQRPDSTAYALPYSGLYSMRSGWDKEAICMVLKCGPDGGGHCQPDNGTFDIYAGGRNLMPDAGSYIYSGDPEGRSWFRQTKVHQTLTLNGENSDYVPTLLFWKPGENVDILVVENQSYEKLKHRRSVFFVDKKYFVVVDEAIGEATGDVGIHFQLAPESEAVFSNRDMTFQTNLKEGWNIYVQSQKQPEMNLEKEEGWVSFEYTRKEPRPTFQYKIQKKDANQKITFYTLVIPFKNRIPKVEIVANKAKSAGELQFKIIENGKRKSFGYKL
jgi:heparan-sulfate lyase